MSSLPHSSPSVLVVDDTPMNLKLTSVLLRSEGFEVYTASGAEEALFLLQTTKPNLVLMDLQMPEVNGLELTRMLKANPATAEIPVVALTAYAMLGDEKRALDAGCVGYITKPINTREFRKTICQYMK